MVGPGGTSPVVAYDFSKFDPALSTAQNLVAANMSGDSALDLVAVGAAKIDYLTLSGDTGQSPYGWTPFSCRSDGGALKSGFHGGGDSYATTAGAPAAIRFQAAMTAEWLGYVTENVGAVGGPHLVACLAAGETEAANIQYALVPQVIAGNIHWRYAHEDGAGSDDVCHFFITPDADFAQTIFNPVQLVITRASGGLGVGTSVRFYINGRLAQIASAITGVSPLPTGGTSANLRISSANDSTTAKFETLGVRLFDVELTAAQVQESYRRTFFGVST